MTDFNHEIGDRFISVWGEEVVIRDRVVDWEGAHWYWMINEQGTPASWPQPTVDEWKKIEPFFEVGDWWEDEEGARHTVTHVDLDLRAIWTICERGNGRRRESLGDYTWRYRKNQILKNRKG